jgi:tetratricopeptide (TPR) repeat protein
LVVRVLVVALVVGGAAWWWWPRRSAPVPDPPAPSGIDEPEVVEALQRKRRAVLARPESADAWGEYGMQLLAQLFDREAEVCFDEAARLAPEDPRWPYTRGHVALKKNLPNAPELLRRAIATTGPGDEYRTAARLMLAETFLEQGALDEAATLFEQELGPPPGQPRAAYGLGLVAVARGDEATAARYMSGLLTNEHAKKQANVQLARLARAGGDERAARRFEDEAAKLPEPTAWPDPMFDEIPMLAVGRRGRERRVFFLEQKHRYAAAIEAYRADLEVERAPKALIGAGINYIRLGDYERGIAYMREAVERDPKSPIATYNLALVLFTRAEKEADRRPGSPDARAWFEEVVVQTKRTTELKPDHARAYLFWGLALKHLGNPKGAVEPFRRGLIARPEEFELHLGLGQVLAELGERAEAERCFENARLIDPRDPRPDRELEHLRTKK